MFPTDFLSFSTFFFLQQQRRKILAESRFRYSDIALKKRESKKKSVTGFQVNKEHYRASVNISKVLLFIVIKFIQFEMSKIFSALWNFDFQKKYNSTSRQERECISRKNADFTRFLSLLKKLYVLSRKDESPISARFDIAYWFSKPIFLKWLVLRAYCEHPEKNRVFCRLIRAAIFPTNEIKCNPTASNFKKFYIAIGRLNLNYSFGILSWT